MHRSVTLVVAVFLNVSILVVCREAAASDYGAEEVSASRTEMRLVELGVQSFSGQSAPDCTSADITVASSKARVIEARTKRFYGVLDDSNRFSRVEQNAALNVLKQLNPMALDAQFLVADAYLAADCLDLADEIYRRIVKTYIGRAFDSYRQRAQIGVDDVRAQRASLE